MKITADQFVTRSGRRVLIDDNSVSHTLNL